MCIPLHFGSIFRTIQEIAVVLQHRQLSQLIAINHRGNCLLNIKHSTLYPESLVGLFTALIAILSFLTTSLDYSIGNLLVKEFFLKDFIALLDYPKLLKLQLGHHTENQEI